MMKQHSQKPGRNKYGLKKMKSAQFEELDRGIELLHDAKRKRQDCTPRLQRERERAILKQIPQK
jgi:hypothetical protein